MFILSETSYGHTEVIPSSHCVFHTYLFHRCTGGVHTDAGGLGDGGPDDSAELAGLRCVPLWDLAARRPQSRQLQT